MIEVEVVDIHDNGLACVRLDDGEYFDNVPVSFETQIGDRLPMSANQITSAYDIPDCEEYDDRPGFDWCD